MKKNDWKINLAQFLIDSASKPFKWGDFDCVLFSADGVLAQTGVDLAAEYRNTYSTKKEAYSLIEKKWNGDLHLTVSQNLPIREGTPQVGDVVVLDRPEGFVCGLYTGYYVACISLKGRYDVSLDKNSIVYAVD